MNAEQIDACNTLEELFALWKEMHREEENVKTYLDERIPQKSFLPDGIIDVEKYQQAKTKILFIAKEANWFYYEGEKENQEAAESDMFWHRKVAFKEVPETMFSKRVSMLANAIFTNDFEKKNKFHAVMQSIAVINLNKRGGFPYCDGNCLYGYVERYQDMIRREIELIDPSVIICCGKDVHRLFDSYLSGKQWEDKKILKLSHPSYFKISDADYLHQLEDALKGDS